MADAHRRRFDAVAVWKFDRFARSVSHLLRALETFKALGIDFVSLSEQVDTSTPTGIRNARAKGKRLGRPRIAVDSARIAALRAQGCSWSAICPRDGHRQGDGATGLLRPAKEPCVIDSLILRKWSRRFSRAGLLEDAERSPKSLSGGGRRGP
jgi:hypothetical protein